MDEMRIKSNTKKSYMGKKILGAILIIVCIFSCYFLIHNKRETIQNVDKHPDKTIVFLQPLDNYTQQEAMLLQNTLKNEFKGLFHKNFEIRVLPNINLTAELKNQNNTRYRADKIIGSLKKEASNHKIIIGLTHKDVSVPYKGKSDWGVLGLSIHGSYACVVSDYRLKNKKRDYWKVVCHEFIHTAYLYGHCPKDSSTCIMKDAKGKADFSNKKRLCGHCRNALE